MPSNDIQPQAPYGDYPLRLLGSDVPYTGDRSDITQKDVSTVGKDMNELPRNLQNLNGLSYSAIQDSAKDLTKGVQVAQQTTDTLTQAATGANSAFIPAAEARARVNAYSPNQTPQYFESIARTISGMVQSQNQGKILKMQQQQKLQDTIATELQKNSEAAQKQTQEQQYTKALLAMSDHTLGAEGQIKDATGVEGFRQKGLDIINQFPDLSETDKQKLLTDMFGAERRVIDKQSTEQQKSLTEANQARTASAKADFGLAMTGQISALQTGFISKDQFRDNLDQSIKTYQQAHPELSIRDMMEIQAAQMTAAEKASLTNENHSNQLIEKQQQAQGFLKDVSPFYEQFQSGKMSEVDFQMREAMLADKYGVPRNLVPALEKPNMAMEEMVRRQELQNKVNVLSQNNAISQEQTQPVDPLHVGYLVSLLKGTAGLDESVRANKVVYNNPDWRRALKVYEDEGKAETKVSQLQKEYDTYNKAINAELSGGVKESAQLPGGITLQAIPQDLQLVAQKQLTPQQLQQLQDIRKNNVDTIRGAMARTMQEIENVRQPLRVYGWDNGFQSWNNAYNQYKDHIDFINKAHSIVQSGATSALPPTPNAPNPNFNYAAAPSKLSLMKASYGGRQLLLPFLNNATFQGFSDGYGSPGNGANEHHDHFHRGLDLAAPEGTPVQAHGYGVVKHSYDPSQSGGYGNMLDILYQDGKVVRYGHLHARATNEGDEVFPGEVVGTVGHTGHASGPHLHFEVRNDAEFSDEGSTDPVAYLNSLANGSSTTAPRTNNFDKVDRFNPYQASNQYQLPKEIIPKGAVQIPGGYIIGNKVIPYKNPSGDAPVDSRLMYNSARPMTGSAAPTTRSGYGANDPGANYGYAPIARDKQFAAKISDVSTKLGIPGAWLADIMGFETGNSFNPADDNGVGYGGLIGFGDADAKQFGLGNRYDLFKMDRLHQMDYVYKYLAPYKDKLTDIQSTLAVVFGGAGLLNKWKNDPQGAMSRGDGAITFGSYLRRLGEGVGRQYKL